MNASPQNVRNCASVGKNRSGQGAYRRLWLEYFESQITVWMGVFERTGKPPHRKGGGGIDEMRPRCLTRPEPRGSAIKKRTVATPLAPGQDTQIHRSMNQHHRKQEQVLWLCVSPERNTDPLRSDHPSRANGVDLCFAETKHRSRDASHPDLSKPSER